MTGAHHVRRPGPRDPVVRAESLTRLLADIRPGCEIVAVTGGQWALAEMLAALVARLGAAVELDVATWTAAAATIRGFDELLAAGGIARMRWVLDRSFPGRQPRYAADLLRRFGPEAIRCGRTHAKWATLMAPGWTLAVRSSMNLNSNPRMEIVEISDDPALCAFLRDVVDAFWRELPPGFPDHATMTAGQGALWDALPANDSGDDGLEDAWRRLTT